MAGDISSRLLSSPRRRLRRYVFVDGSRSLGPGKLCRVVVVVGTVELNAGHFSMLVEIDDKTS